MTSCSYLADSLLLGDADLGDAPRFCDFRNLEADRANISAWFDSHESFYADATFLHPATPKRKRTAASSKVKRSSSLRTTTSAAAAQKKTATSSSSSSSHQRQRIKSASLTRPALHAVNGQDSTSSASDAKRSLSKRAASVASGPSSKASNAQQPTADKENANPQVASAVDQIFTHANGAGAQSEPLLGMKIPFSPIPQVKPFDREELDQRILQRVEEQRRARKKASVAQPLEVLRQPETAQTATDDAQSDVPSKMHTNADVEEGESESEQPVIEERKPIAKKAALPSANNRVPTVRTGGKHVPIAKKLEQQRTRRLVNEMNKQRERAKGQREQQYARTKMVEEAKKEREQERLARKKEKQEQVELLKRQREQEKEQRLREREQRDAEERERKLARIAEKQHRQPLPIKEKQLLQEELAVRSVKPLTCPKEFHFATDARLRSHKLKSEEQAPQEKVVRPAVKKSTSSKPKSITKPKAFVFSTEARAALRRPREPTSNGANAERSPPPKRRRKMENQGRPQ